MFYPHSLSEKDVAQPKEISSKAKSEKHVFMPKSLYVGYTWNLLDSFSLRVLYVSNVREL